MSVDRLDVIDISTDPQGYLALTISDRLDWSSSVEHLTILQAKQRVGLLPYRSCSSTDQTGKRWHSEREQKRSSNGLASNSDTEFLQSPMATDG